MRFIIFTFELLLITIGGVFQRISRGAKRPIWKLGTELSQKMIDHSLD